MRDSVDDDGDRDYGDCDHRAGGGKASNNVEKSRVRGRESSLSLSLSLYTGDLT